MKIASRLRAGINALTGTETRIPAPQDHENTTESNYSENGAVAAETPQKLRGLAAWPTGMRFSLAIATTLFIMLVLTQIAPVFMPTFLAFALALTVRPVSDWLIRHGAPIGLAAAVAIAILFAILFAMIGLIAAAITAMITILPQYAPKFQALYEQAIAELARHGLDTSSVLDSARNVDLGKVFTYLSGFANQIGGAGTTLFFIVMVAIFVVGDLVMIRRRAAELASYAPGFAIALRNFSVRVRKYFLVTTIFGAIVALLDVVILYIFGVPTP